MHVPTHNFVARVFKNEIPKELFDLKGFYNCKYQELKEQVSFKCFIE